MVSVAPRVVAPPVAACPGRNPVLLVTGQLVAAPRGHHDVRPLDDRLDPARH